MCAIIHMSCWIEENIEKYVDDDVTDIRQWC